MAENLEVIKKKNTEAVQERHVSKFLGIHESAWTKDFLEIIEFFLSSK